MLQTLKMMLLAKAYKNKFVIPLDFEMLDIAMPYYQAVLGNKLCYEVTFNDYGKVINATGKAVNPDAKYEMKGITLEYEIFTQPDITHRITTEYQILALQCDRVLRH